MTKIKIKTKKVKKIAIKDELPESINPFLLTDYKAGLLKEACLLDKQKKEAEKRIKEIKEELDLNLPGDYSNAEGNTLKLTEVPKLTDPDPKEFYDLMDEKNVEKFFWKCIKVTLTEAKKYVPENDINSLRITLEPIKKYSFK